MKFWTQALPASLPGVLTEIFDNSTPLFSGPLLLPAASQPDKVGAIETFSLTENLNAGDIISFGVNSAGIFLDDMTGFDATITQKASAVPKPTSLVLFGTALAGFGLIRRRRRPA